MLLVLEAWLVVDQGIGDRSTRGARIASAEPSVQIVGHGAALWDPAFLIMDVVGPSRFSRPARLSQESVINLAENGVPYEVFYKLLKNTLEETFKPFSEIKSLEHRIAFADYLRKVNACAVLEKRLTRCSIM